MQASDDNTGAQETIIPPLAAARLQLWAILLSAYDYHLDFRPSQSHSNADGLSRLPLKTERSVAYSSGYLKLHFPPLILTQCFFNRVSTSARF